MSSPDTVAPQLDLRFVRRGERTVLDRRRFAWPFTLARCFHLDRSPAHMLTVLVQTASGAIQADDRLAQVIHVAAGAAAHVTGQGATAVHRAPSGRGASEAVMLEVEAGAVLEYWPEPKILFPQSDLSQSVGLTCRPGGMALMADAVLMHDPGGTGRPIRRFAAETVVRGDESEPLLIDRMAFDGTAPGRGRRGRLRAFGTVHAILPGASALAEELCQGWNDAITPIEGLYGAASLLPNGAGVGLRFAAEGGIPLRHVLDTAWATARKVLTGELPASRRK